MGESRDIWEEYKQREDAKEAQQKEPSDLQLYGKTQLYYSIFMLSFLAIVGVIGVVVVLLKLIL